MKRFDNVTLFVDAIQGEMTIVVDKKEGSECLENEFLCSVELNNNKEEK